MPNIHNKVIAQMFLSFFAFVLKTFKFSICEKKEKIFHSHVKFPYMEIEKK